MALETALASPATKKRLLNGPLIVPIESFCQWVMDQQFSTGTTQAYLLNVSFFHEYLKDRYPNGIVRVCRTDVDGFLHSRPGKGGRTAIRRLVGYLEERGLYDCGIPPLLCQPILDSYTEWLRQYKDAAEDTIRINIEHAREFLDRLGPQATVEGLASLEASQIQDFCVSFAKRRPASSQRMGVALRCFLRFCLHAGYINRSFDAAVPSVRHYRLDTVPHGLTEEEGGDLLAAIDRQTPAGRRDYAICLMLHTYGIRGRQLRDLQLQDIYWERNEIFFKGMKGGKSSLLPLTVEVGESLLDYVQNVRARGTAHTEVFLTATAPCRPLGRSTVNSVVQRYAHAAGIKGPYRGAHAFRHAFAARMLQQGHSLKAIADVLGHRNVSTTFIYTKVDFAALSQVPLPWPGKEQR